jgi:AbrB family looped-hinge helix DNA binding protein
MVVETPDVPRHVHEIQSNGTITVPKDLRDEFDTEEFCVFERDGQIILHPVRSR